MSYLRGPGNVQAPIFMQPPPLPQFHRHRVWVNPDEKKATTDAATSHQNANMSFAAFRRSSAQVNEVVPVCWPASQRDNKEKKTTRQLRINSPPVRAVETAIVSTKPTGFSPAVSTTGGLSGVASGGAAGSSVKVHEDDDDDDVVLIGSSKSIVMPTVRVTAAPIAVSKAIPPQCGQVAQSPKGMNALLLYPPGIVIPPHLKARRDRDPSALESAVS